MKERKAGLSARGSTIPRWGLLPEQSQQREAGLASPSRLREDSGFPLLLCVLLIAGAVFVFTRGWLDNGIPLEDFPGNVAHVSDLRQNLGAEHWLTQWCPTWFGGQPRTMLFSRFLSAAVPLALSFLGPVVCIKVTLILFHFLSGLAMFLFLGDLTRDRGIRTVGSVMYAVHPMAIVESAQHGHLEVAMFYAIVPLVFWMGQRALRSERTQESILLGLFVSIGLWLNNEGSFVTFPFLGVLLVSSVLQERRTPIKSRANEAQYLLRVLLRKGTCIAIALATALGCCAFFWLPVLAEKGLYNFFSQSHIDSAIREFSFRNVLYTVNRDGFLFRALGDLPPDMTKYGPDFYLGIVPILLALTGLFVRRPMLTGERLKWFSLAWIAFVLSFGAYTVLDTVGDLFSSAEFRSLALDAFSIVFFVGFGLLLLFHLAIFRYVFSRRYEFLFLLALLGLGVLVPWFRVLRVVLPFYRDMRAPFWFYVTPCVFATCVLAGVGMETIRTMLPRGRQQVFVLMLLLLVILDFKPYDRIFFANQESPRMAVEMADLGDRIGADKDWCRTLGAESYNPTVDMLAGFTGKATAWSWLNWSAPKAWADLVFDGVYPLMFEKDERPRAKAAVLAGLCNVKYVIDDLDEPPNVQADQNGPLKPVWGGKRFVVYENKEFRPFVQVYPQAVAYVGPFDSEARDVLVYCATMNTAVYEVEPRELAGHDWSKYDFVLWNLRADTEGRPVPIPAEIPKERLINMLEKQPFTLAYKAVPALEMVWSRRSGEIHLERSGDTVSTTTLHLVVSESWAPGWNAKIGGARAPVLKGNHAFLALDLLPNWQDVVLNYRRPYYSEAGYVVTVFSFLILVFVFGRGILRRRISTSTSANKALVEVCAGLDRPIVAPTATRPDILLAKAEHAKAAWHRDFSARRDEVKNTQSGRLSLPGSEFTRTDWLLMFLVGVLGLLLYIRTLAPTVTAEDGGELIAAAWNLGVPHPPGYPTFVVLGHLFSKLPFGPNVAWRVNLMSACFGSLCAALLFLIFRTFGLARMLSFFAAICFVATATFWSQSVIAKGTVYLSSAAAQLFAIIMVHRYSESRRMGYLYIAVAAVGVGITCHYSTLLFLLPLFLCIVWLAPRAFFSTRTILTFLAIFLLSLSPMLLPWYFAQVHPPLDWGRPDSFSRWLDVVRRVQYRGLEFSEQVPLGDKLKFFANYLREFSAQFSPLGFLLAVIGFVRLRRRLPVVCLLVAGLFLMNALVLTIGLHFRFLPINLLRVHQYYVVSYVCAWIAIVFGYQSVVDFLRSHLRRQTRSSSAVLALLSLGIPFLSATVLLLLVNWHACDFSKYLFARDYADNILKSLRKDAIVFPIGDHQTFPIAYLKFVEKERPDVLIGDLYGYLEDPVLDEFRTVTGRDPSLLSRDEIEEGLIRYSKRPLYFFRYMKPSPPDNDRVSVPMGVCYEIMSSDDAKTSETAARQDALWESFRLRGVNDSTAYRDDMASSICGAYSFMYGDLLLSRGNLKEALAEYEKSVRFEGEGAEALNNIAASLAERGFKVQSKPFLYRALERSPGYKFARLNLASLLLEEGNPSEALEHYRLALRFNPGDPEIRDKIKQLVDSARQSGIRPPLSSTEHANDVSLGPIRSGLVPLRAPVSNEMQDVSGEQ